jgi:hypothetical protein
MGGEPFSLDCVFCHAQVHGTGDMATFQHPLAGHGLGQAQTFPRGVVRGRTDGLTDPVGLGEEGGIDLRVRLLPALAQVVKSAEKGARKSAQMGATYTIDYSVREDAVNKTPDSPLRGSGPIMFYSCFFLSWSKLDLSR